MPTGSQSGTPDILWDSELSQVLLVVGMFVLSVSTVVLCSDFRGQPSLSSSSSYCSQ